MKIFFTGSSGNQKGFKKQFGEVVKSVLDQGHTNINNLHFSHPDKEKIAAQLKSEEDAYNLTISQIDSSDLVVAEITNESTKVGYQISYALSKKTPTLVLYLPIKEDKLPIVLSHEAFGLMDKKQYASSEEAVQNIKDFIDSLEGSAIKFNFYLNLRLHNLLARKARETDKSKSDVVREILEKSLRN